jgi:SAM-dependent methyltransferase
MTTDPSATAYNRDLKPLNSSFKGRGRDYLTLLTCPADRAALRLHGDAVGCTADPAHVYPFVRGILRLVPSDSHQAVDEQSEAHEAACAAQGRTSPDEAEFKSLPQGGLSGYPEGYWTRQAEGTALLWRFLEASRWQVGALPVGPMGEAAVIGAGMGWLAYGLDVAGYTTLAIDTRAGERFGLGVYPIARYLRVQADLTWLPLADGAFDWVIFQEGLGPYGERAAQEAAFVQALRALRPGGWLAVMNNHPASSADAGALRAVFQGTGLAPLTSVKRQSWRGRLLDLRDRLAGRDRAVSPVMVAQKPTRGER